jgi:hypothetical protein
VLGGQYPIGHIHDAYVLEADRLRVLTSRPGGWQPVAEAARASRGRH